MTDAQSFYLLLAIFYLIECLASAPSGSQAFVSKGTGARRWRMRRLAFPVHGFRKEIFLAPLLPWPGMLAQPERRKSYPPVSPWSLRHFIKRARFLRDSTAPLRTTGFLLFVHFFVLLPVIYYFYARTHVMLFAVGYGYLLCLLTSVRFWALHKRYFPKLKSERFKHTIYSAFLPWHAMRAADVIIARRTSSWNPIVILASDPTALSNKKKLRRAWNEAALRSGSEPSREELEMLFEQAGLDVEEYTAPPEVSEDEAYCPICETIYLASTRQCANCAEISLVSPQRTKD